MEVKGRGNGLKGWRNGGIYGVEVKGRGREGLEGVKEWSRYLLKGVKAKGRLEGGGGDRRGGGKGKGGGIRRGGGMED